jgi:hypothetical protein
MVLALVLSATFALAHKGIEHVMGTVSAITQNSITVTTVKHTNVTVLLDASSKFSHNNADASWKDIRVGDRIVVNAKPNADKKLVAISVRWGANSSAHTDHPGHKH